MGDRPVLLPQACKQTAASVPVSVSVSVSVPCQHRGDRTPARESRELLTVVGSTTSRGPNHSKNTAAFSVQKMSAKWIP